jgi:hypothetical protein
MFVICQIRDRDVHLPYKAKTAFDRRGDGKTAGVSMGVVYQG